MVQISVLFILVINHCLDFKASGCCSLLVSDIMKGMLFEFDLSMIPKHFWRCTLGNNNCFLFVPVIVSESSVQRRGLVSTVSYMCPYYNSFCNLLNSLRVDEVYHDLYKLLRSLRA